VAPTTPVFSQQAHRSAPHGPANKSRTRLRKRACVLHLWLFFEVLAAVATQEGHPREAHQALQKCRPLLEHLATRRIKAYYWYQEAVLALFEERLDDAEDALREMHATTSEHDRELRAKRLFGQARLSLCRGDRKLA